MYRSDFDQDVRDLASVTRALAIAKIAPLIDQAERAIGPECPIDVA